MTPALVFLKECGKISSQLPVWFYEIPTERSTEMAEDRAANEGHTEDVAANEGDVEGHQLTGANEGDREANEGDREANEGDVEAHQLIGANEGDREANEGDVEAHVLAPRNAE
jgi:hypothetical protein